MAAAVKIDQQKAAPSRLAALFDIDDSDLDQLEEFFVEATAAQGVPGRKIFANLRAGASLGEAFGVADDVIEFLYARAHRWAAVGRHNKAEPLFRVLCILDGESADFWVGLGICLKARAEWEEALAAFRMASQKRSQWPVPHFHALVLHLRRESWSLAAAELTEFDKKADSGTPAALRTEVEKFRRLLRLRTAKDAGKASNQDGVSAR